MFTHTRIYIIKSTSVYCMSILENNKMALNGIVLTRVEIIIKVNIIFSADWYFAFFPFVYKLLKLLFFTSISCI